MLIAQLTRLHIKERNSGKIALFKKVDTLLSVSKKCPGFAHYLYSLSRFKNQIAFITYGAI